MALEVRDAAGTGPAEFDGNQLDPSSPEGAAPQPPIQVDYVRTLSRFDPISLAEMDRVTLLDRVDTKYVMSMHRLREALAGLPEHYRALTVDGVRVMRYRTLYFDTDALALYRSHHSSGRGRYKVRSREYADTGQAFLEVKWKAKRDRTVKERVPTNGLLTHWTPDTATSMGLELPAAAQALKPKVFVEFFRVTLVGRYHRERVTLDLGLRYSGWGRCAAIPGVAVAEVKQDGVDRGSPFVRQMREAGIRPCGFSKYCIGVSMLYQGVKHNRFKPTLRLISRLKGGADDD